MTSTETLIGNNSAQFFEALKQAMEQAKKKEWNDTVIKGQFPVGSIAQAKPLNDYTLIPINADALTKMIGEMEQEKRVNEKTLELMKKILEPFFQMLDENDNPNN